MSFIDRIGGDRVHGCRVASLSRPWCAHSEKEERGLPDGTAPSAYRTMVRHGRDWLGLVGSGRVGCGLLGSSRVGKGLVPTSRVCQEIREKGGGDCGCGADKDFAFNILSVWLVNVLRGKLYLMTRILS